MRKILVIGSGGAGKSTFSRRLSAGLGIPVIHLDAHYWRSDWVEPSKAEWLGIVAELVRTDAWIMDGNYGGSLELRLAACDTVIFLDLPRPLCLWRVVKRALMYRGTSRPDMAPGCPERLNLEFLQWVWNYPRRSRPAVLARLAELEGHKRVIRLRSPGAVRRFLRDCQSPDQAFA